MSIDLDELEAKAKAATPGPWRTGYLSKRCLMDHKHEGKATCKYEPWQWIDDDGFEREVSTIHGQPVVSWDADHSSLPETADAAFIAAANPAIVLSLIALVRELQADVLLWKTRALGELEL